MSKSQFDSSYFQRNTFYATSSSIRRRQWQPTPVLLPGKSHGQKSLVGYSSHGVTELDTAEWLHFHFSVSGIGGGNGSPLQCSSIENPRDGGAWWAAIYGFTQSWTRLKQLSSNSSSLHRCWECKLMSHYREQYRSSLKKTRNKTTMWPSNPITGHIP